MKDIAQLFCYYGGGRSFPTCYSVCHQSHLLDFVVYYLELLERQERGRRSGGAAGSGGGCGEQ